MKVWTAVFFFLLISCSSSKKEAAPAEAVAKPIPGAPEPTSEIPARRDFPVNASVSPCKDFYRYTCDLAISGFKLREDRSYHTFSFSDSEERLLEAKKKFLSGLKEEKKLSSRGQSLRNVYLACMDEEASKKEEVSLVKENIAKIRSLKTHEALQNYFGRNILEEDVSPLEIGQLPNLDDPEWYDLLIVGKWQNLPERSYYDKPDVIADYEKYVEAFFETIGADRAGERAKNVVAFEKEFSQTYPLPAEFRELVSTRTGITRDDLLKNYPNLKLGGMLAKIPKRTHIRHLTPANLDWLNKALAERPVELLQDVALFQGVRDYMDDAYPEFFKKRFEFNNKHMGGPPVRPPRDERCAKMVKSSFMKELDAELWPRLFPDFPTKRFIGMAEKVRFSIIDGLMKNQWLSAKTKAAAIEKVKKAKLQLVAPQTDEEWDFTPPAKYSPTKRYANARLLEKNLTLKALKEFAKPRNRERWGMGPLTINAYYSSSDNKFVMPVGILQYPFFDKNLSDEANLGAVGSVIGHELGHGIDDKGAKYDATGKLTNWFSENDLSEFKKRGERLGKFFDSAGYNSKLTLGENIGDLVGVTFSYNAAFPGGQGAPEKKREFFQQYARVWCNVVRPKLREMIIKTDPHPMGEARVNEILKHHPGFAEAYSCKVGDPMVLAPTDRASIW